MSQVSPEMSLPSRPAPEYKQDPERVALLLRCLKLRDPVGFPPKRVTGYANLGALYTFRFSDLTEELLDGTAPDDAVQVVAEQETARTWQTTRAKHEATEAALAVARQEVANRTEEAAFWKGESERKSFEVVRLSANCRNWAAFSAVALFGGSFIGCLLGRLA